MLCVDHSLLPTLYSRIPSSFSRFLFSLFLSSFRFLVFSLSLSFFLFSVFCFLLLPRYWQYWQTWIYFFLNARTYLSLLFFLSFLLGIKGTRVLGVLGIRGIVVVLCCVLCEWIVLIFLLLHYNVSVNSVGFGSLILIRINEWVNGSDSDLNEMERNEMKGTLETRSCFFKFKFGC